MLFRVASVSAFVLRANQVQTLTLIRLPQCVVFAGALPKVPDLSFFRQDNIGRRSWLMLMLMLASFGCIFSQLWHLTSGPKLPRPEIKVDFTGDMKTASLCPQDGAIGCPAFVSTVNMQQL